MNRKIAARVSRKIKALLYRYSPALPTSLGVSDTFNVDSPVKGSLDSRDVSVEGWIIPSDKKKIVAIRARMGEREYKLKHGLKRVDVAKAFPDSNEAMYSGFSGSAEIDKSNQGELVIEVDTGAGFREIYRLELHYSPEMLVDDIYNPDLAKNMAEHLNLLDNKKRLFYEDPLKSTYQRSPGDPRLVAFYLPQFHPIPENDKVWGQGFTEWTNVTSDTSRFIGHQQPILPGDQGFYDLRLEENIKSQIDRAKKHGIYGFCFYYYWFSGRRLLGDPLDSFLKHQEWDFNFTICWANENWTKRWDGRDSEVIVAQEYNDDDPLRFIKDVEDILLDPRYIREDGKPVLLVFRASELKDPENYSKVWREHFKKKHSTELHLVSIVSFEDRDPREYGFDVALDFAPQSSFFKNDCFEGGRYPMVNVADKLLDKNFNGMVADYREIALNKKTYTYFNFPSYKSVTPSWDNDARKKGKGFVMVNENPDIYRQWLDNVLKLETDKAPSPLVFINAWNEWAEGAILEPSRHYGSAVLNRTTEVLAKYSTSEVTSSQFPAWSIKRNQKTKLAVILHLYYIDRWDYVREKLQALGSTEYDLFVSLNEKNSDFRDEIMKFNPDAYVQIVPNRGRDILPFVYLLARLKEAGYSAILKLHSKKSTHRLNGLDWFEELVTNLLPNKETVREITDKVVKEHCIVGPNGHYISLKRYMGSNEVQLGHLLARITSKKSANSILKSSSAHGYFAGSMFWANLEAINPLVDLHLAPEDFESERGQIDGTTAHAVERLISLLAVIEGHQVELYESSPGGLYGISGKTPLDTYGYAE